MAEPFAVRKEQFRPSIGPNTYSQQKMEVGSSAVISPGKWNRSTIDIKRTTNETNLGPGRYKINSSSFKTAKVSSTTFGSASRAFKINTVLEFKQCY